MQYLLCSDQHRFCFVGKTGVDGSEPPKISAGELKQIFSDCSNAVEFSGLC